MGKTCLHGGFIRLPECSAAGEVVKVEFAAGTVENHREREKGVLVYPVYSRRAGGLSVGINLYPDKKSCPFNCPYCEVFPFSSNAAFNLAKMEEDLRITLASALKDNIPVKDICFSGNGEPTLSPFFEEALKSAVCIRDELVPSAHLVIITNGAGLLNKKIFSLLKDAATEPIEAEIWLKLDAGTPEWFSKINRAEIQFEKLISKIKEFVLRAPVTIQTMLCAIDGSPPLPEEAREWEKLVLELASSGNIRKVQIYGKARPAPEDPLASELPLTYLEERAASLRSALSQNNSANVLPVEVYQ